MAAKMKLCLIVHVEDDAAWDQDEPGGLARGLGDLATKVGQAISPGPAKLSVQFGRDFLDTGGGYTAPSSLRMILENGGNFWCHTHSASAEFLDSVYTCVKSAYDGEGGAGSFPNGGVGGRSGGWDIELSCFNWVSISMARGLRLMNSATQHSYTGMAEVNRPYALTNEEIERYYGKGQAPGPMRPDIHTLRTRPFWMNSTNAWDANLTACLPSNAIAAAVGSVMMIPAPGHLDLNALAAPRPPRANRSIQMEDLNAAVTQMWSTYTLMSANSITHAWYIHIPAREINADLNSSLACMVQTINYLMDVNVTTLGEWKNMNEIGSLFANPSSFYY